MKLYLQKKNSPQINLADNKSSPIHKHLTVNSRAIHTIHQSNIKMWIPTRWSWGEPGITSPCNCINWQTQVNLRWDVLATENQSPGLLKFPPDNDKPWPTGSMKHSYYCSTGKNLVSGACWALAEIQSLLRKKQLSSLPMHKFAVYSIPSNMHLFYLVYSCVKTVIIH